MLTFILYFFESSEKALFQYVFDSPPKIFRELKARRTAL